MPTALRVKYMNAQSKTHFHVTHGRGCRAPQKFSDFLHRLYAATHVSSFYQAAAEAAAAKHIVGLEFPTQEPKEV